MNALTPEDRPREKLLTHGSRALGDNELLALVIGSGCQDHDALSVANALLAHCAGSLSGVGGVERPGIVHRLDRETTGVILVAKTDAAHRALADQFATRALKKEYLALVAGVPKAEGGLMDRAI